MYSTGEEYVIYDHFIWSFPGDSAVRNLPANARDRFDPWVGKLPWRRKWQLIPVFLSAKSHGHRRLAIYSPWGLKRVRHNLVTKQQMHGVNLNTKGINS